MRDFETDSAYPSLDLENMLLVIAQVGTFAYSVCSIVVGMSRLVDQEKLDAYSNLLICMVLTSLFTLIQTLLQTFFVLDASRKIPDDHQIKHKPGREAMIFLFVCNMFMWTINIYRYVTWSFLFFLFWHSLLLLC